MVGLSLQPLHPSQSSVTTRLKAQASDHMVCLFDMSSRCA